MKIAVLEKTNFNLEQKSKLEKLEIQFLEMQKSIDQMKELVSESEKSDVDYRYVEKCAKSNQFITHNIANEEEEIIYKYCCCLAAVAELTNVTEQKVKLYYHVFRIYHTCMEEDVYENLIRDSKTISIEDLLFLKENLQSVHIQNFLVDMLLMISFDENKNEKQMDYFCEVVGFLGISQKELEKIMQVVKAILLIDIEALCKELRSVYYSLGYCLISKRVNARFEIKTEEDKKEYLSEMKKDGVEGYFSYLDCPVIVEWDIERIEEINEKSVINRFATNAQKLIFGK